MEFPRQANTTNFNTSFCLKLANNILQKKAAENGSNTVISPFSFHLLLSLIAVGSKGRTLKQLSYCLRSKSLEDINSLSSQMIELASPVNENNGGATNGDPDLSFVNAAWVAQGLELKPSFQEIVEGVYHAVAKEVDFVNQAEQVVAEVNAWAKTATRGLINNLLTTEALKSINDDTALILANALYFKGTWAQLFDTSKTKERVFHLLNGQKVHVPFMTGMEFERYQYKSFDGYKILKLPYKNSHPTRKFAMYFFLPDARDGLKNLLQPTRFESNPEYFNKRFDLVEEKMTDFWIPRFKFSFEFEASEAMIQMGLDLPFDRTKAEITEMVESRKGLFVRKMFHKCFIEVNEEGTKAAACTAFIAEKVCLRYPIASFVADHPFMFMIKEETSGVVFFVGSVHNPLLDS